MIYVASPYTSHATGALNRSLEEDARAYAAARYVALLLSNQLCAWSPIAHGHAIKLASPDIPGDYEFWKAMAREQLTRSDLVHILMLPGWAKSIGVTDEINFCSEINKPVVRVVPPLACFERAVA